MQIIATIEGEPITEGDDNSVEYSSKMAIDGDGTGSSHGDPDYQSRTSLRYRTQFLNADVDRYIVVPPAIINGVKGIVLGCKAIVKDLRSGLWTDAVVGDIGPHHKLGEASIATAEVLHDPSSPTKGGVDEHVIGYKLWPGIPAVVDGKTYELQAS